MVGADSSRITFYASDRPGGLGKTIPLIVASAGGIRSVNYSPNEWVVSADGIAVAYIC